MTINKANAEITIADLDSRFQEIEKEARNEQFFMKIAQYGKYLLENEAVNEVLQTLYQEADNDAKPYVEAWEKFIKRWHVLAKDILKKAKKDGVEDDPNDRFSSPIAEITNLLKKQRINIYLTELDHFYTPYKELVWKFEKLGKLDQLIPKHYPSMDDKTPDLGTEYVDANYKWKTFELSRQTQVWWAHYQVILLACGVFNLEVGRKYFNTGGMLESFYKYEFNEISQGNTPRAPVFLKRDRYEQWIKRLHNFLIPRLKYSEPFDNQTILVGQPVFYPLDGRAEFKGNIRTFVSKAKAFLTVLNGNRNTTYTVNEIKSSCNKLIPNPKFYFRAEKDIDDTLAQVKKNLKVRKGEYFPIMKQGKNWIWVQK